MTRCTFEEVGALLGEKQLLMREGTLMDATIIAAPSSTKKGNQCYFGRKAHIGADETSGLVHRARNARRRMSRSSAMRTRCCTGRESGREKRVGADTGYTGLEWRLEVVALGRAIEWRVAARRSSLQAQPEGWAKALNGAWETLKARARALVEHPFHIIMNLFKHRKVRYRGLEENTGQLRVLFALANLYMARRQLTDCAAA